MSTGIQSRKVRSDLTIVFCGETYSVAHMGVRAGDVLRLREGSFFEHTAEICVLLGKGESGVIVEPRATPTWVREQAAERARRSRQSRAARAAP